jgi:serpin B
MKFLIVPIVLTAALPAANAQVVPALNAFANETYQYLARGDDNLILSPFNIATALSMALVGARGRTAEEIQTVLHLKYDPNYNVALGTLLADLTKGTNTGGNELLTANGLWLQTGFAIEPSFERTLASDYRAPLTLLDFIADSETARSRINEWTEEHTKQKIKNLLPAGSLDSRTRLVLTSAIYFDGKWQDPFRDFPHAACGLHSAYRRDDNGGLHEPDLAFWLRRNVVRPDPRNALRRDWNCLRRPTAKECHRLS